MHATVKWVDNAMFVGESGSGHSVGQFQSYFSIVVALQHVGKVVLVDVWQSELRAERIVKRGRIGTI